MKYIYQNSEIEHSFNCHSVSCLLGDKRHMSVLHFDTEETMYLAGSLSEAAKLWTADGSKELLNVGRCG